MMMNDRDDDNMRLSATQFRMQRRNNQRRTDYDEETTTKITEEEDYYWNDTLRTLLCGTQDGNSPLSILRGYEDTIIKRIYSDLVTSWKDSITHTLPAHRAGRMYTSSYHEEDDPEIPSEKCDIHYRGSSRDPIRVRSVEIDEPRCFVELGNLIENRPKVAFSICGNIDFPPPEDRNVNMMPFVMGRKYSLPKNLQPYYESCIQKCCVQPEEFGKVCYLTVAEGFVKAEETQRRGGIHVEAPGSLFFGDAPAATRFVAGIEHRWGCGICYTPDELHGGLYQSSNMSNTCAVWDALIDTTSGAVDTFGGIDNLRPYIGTLTKLGANQLVWLTDKTPHEALPQQRDGYRQFFRLVTSKISLWFEEHSTANPRVPLPDYVKVIKGDKFDALKSSGTTMQENLLFNCMESWKEEEVFKRQLYPEEVEIIEARKSKAKKILKDTEVRMKIDPINYFREAAQHVGKYSKFNEETGVPTHLANGTELTQAAMKKLNKEKMKHARAQMKWNSKHPKKL